MKDIALKPVLCQKCLDCNIDKIKEENKKLKKENVRLKEDLSSSCSYPNCDTECGKCDAYKKEIK